MALILHELETIQYEDADIIMRQNAFEGSLYQFSVNQ
jgi:hypothetical protein